MSKIKAALAAGILILFLFSSCGEMDFNLPASRNYQVSARGEAFSLDEYAALKKDEKIQPFFIHPVNGDPDIGRLIVSVTTPQDKKSLANIRYVLESEAEAGDDSEEGFYSLLVERMDGALPVFSMPEDLEAGPYTIIFQVFGKNQALLSKTEKTVYYMAGDDYNITDISAYLPGLSTPSHLIPLGTMVLLEAGITAGKSLDPYIVWYNNKTIIGEGKVSEGANRMLWQVPSQTGFQNIRAEVIPFPPIPGDVSSVLTPLMPDRILRGKAREISLPVSVKRESPDAVSEFLSKTDAKGKIIWNYHPAGDLDDPNPLPANTLLAWRSGSNDENETPPRWVPAREGFGLGIGPENVYRLPPFFPEIGTRVSFILRFVSLNDGKYFSVSLPNGTQLVFSREEGSFLLTFYGNDEEELLPVEIPLEEDFNTLLLDLTFLEDSLFISLKDDMYGVPKAEKSLDQEISEDSRCLFELGGWSNQMLPVMILGELGMVSFPADSVSNDAATGEDDLL